MAVTEKEVLVIDDTEDLRLLARKIMENSGMRVLEADSVDAAFQILANRLPNVILLDLVMPKKTGFDFLKARSSIPALEGIPVIVVSANTDRESVYKAIGLGAADYVAKPLSTSVVMKKIRKALKDSDFMTYKFPRNTAPTLTCHIPGTISRVSETSFLINSAFKLNPGTVIQLEAERLREIGLDSSTFVTEGNPSLRDSDGCYFSRVNVVGLKSSFSWALKKTGS